MLKLISREINYFCEKLASDARQCTTTPYQSMNSCEGAGDPSKMVSCPCGSSEAKRPHKTVNIFQGYFFMVNFCLGTGFLGVPYSFFYGGYIATIPTLAVTAFVTWLTSTWLLEVMARAQVSSAVFKSFKSSGCDLSINHFNILRSTTMEPLYKDPSIRTPL